MTNLYKYIYMNSLPKEISWLIENDSTIIYKINNIKV